MLGIVVTRWVLQYARIVWVKCHEASGFRRGVIPDPHSHVVRYFLMWILVGCECEEKHRLEKLNGILDSSIDRYCVLLAYVKKDVTFDSTSQGL